LKERIIIDAWLRLGRATAFPRISINDHNPDLSCLRYIHGIGLAYYYYDYDDHDDLLREQRTRNKKQVGLQLGLNEQAHGKHPRGAEESKKRFARKSSHDKREPAHLNFVARHREQNAEETRITDEEEARILNRESRRSGIVSTVTKKD
jgi:hypothetical protein